MATLTAEDVEGMGEDDRDDEEELEEEQEELEAGEGQEEQEEQSNPAASFTFGQDAPPELRGKSPSEVAGLWNELSTAARSLAQEVGRGGSKAEPEPDPIDISTDDLVEGKVTEKLEQFFERKASPYVSQMQKMQASNYYRDAFEMWPHLQNYKEEVDLLVNQATIDQLANPQTWRAINSYIMENHLDEIAEQRVQQKKRKPRAPVTERSKGGGRSGGDEPPKLTKQEKQIARSLGVSLKDYARIKARREEAE